ncbi:hypothetical protein [Salinispora oceanensis]|uniref:hypothetical protein n=1 Tax=Salinispora oceanensis TaxID=1050199 RepID=UPI0003670527|nr:hypothetical protein [Salinispora oceanensis]
MRSVRQTASRLIATVALVVAGLGTVPAAAHGAEHPTESATQVSGFWACSVPSGYTYSSVRRELGVCSPSGFANSYYVVAPSDGIWTCTVPYGYTYSSVRSQLSVCSTSGFANSYYLRVPQTGIWACTVPPGFSYTDVRRQLAVCTPNGFANSYRLVG